jgi:hypothetical protein
MASVTGTATSTTAASRQPRNARMRSVTEIGREPEVQYELARFSRAVSP